MNYFDQEQEKVNQAVINQVKRESQALKQAKTRSRIANKLIVFLSVVCFLIGLMIIIKPYVYPPDVRDRIRQDNLDKIARELDNYRTSHRGSLPMERSRKQWQQEFVSVYLTSSKDFTKDPLSGEVYSFKINNKVGESAIIKERDFKTVYIDQSHKCDAENKIEAVANSNVATVRVLLESGKVYCSNN